MLNICYSSKDKLIQSYQDVFLKYVSRLITGEGFFVGCEILTKRFDFILKKLEVINYVGEFLDEDINLNKIDKDSLFTTITRETKMGLYDKYLLPNFYIENY